MKQNLLKLFLEDESGVTVIEIVLIFGCFNRTCHYFQKSAQFFDSITLRQNNKTKQFYLTGGFICEEMQRKYDDYDVPDFFLSCSLFSSRVFSLPELRQDGFRQCMQPIPVFILFSPNMIRIY